MQATITVAYVYEERRALVMKVLDSELEARRFDTRAGFDILPL